MKPCSGEAFEWIGRKLFLESKDGTSSGYSVSQLLPPQFEAYVKILHRIEASYRLIDDPQPLTEREIEILKVPSCSELRSFVERLRGDGLSPRIRWATLARLLHVPFEPEICHEWFRRTMSEPECWPRFLGGPGQGTLDTEEMSAIIPILRQFTGEQNCFFRFSEIAHIGTNKPILFRGSLDDLPTFLADDKKKLTPEYWWPTDHSWCLCSDYDLDFSFLAGPRALISMVLKDAMLESIEVKPQTRIDSFAPMPER